MELTETERGRINVYASNLVKARLIPDTQVVYDTFSSVELKKMATLLATPTGVNTQWVLNQIRIRN
jgi:hypothetical protein